MRSLGSLCSNTQIFAVTIAFSIVQFLSLFSRMIICTYIISSSFYQNYRFEYFRIHIERYVSANTIPCILLHPHVQNKHFVSLPHCNLVLINIIFLLNFKFNLFCTWSKRGHWYSGLTNLTLCNMYRAKVHKMYGIYTNLSCAMGLFGKALHTNLILVKNKIKNTPYKLNYK